MAGQPALEDPLLALRQSIASGLEPILTKSSTPLTESDPQPSLPQATHIQFALNGSYRTYELTAPTRFLSGDSAASLRTIFFAWQNKDASTPEYIAAVQQLNEQLSAPGGVGGTVQNLSFPQKVELIAWLAGESDSSEFIKPLEANVAAPSTADAAGAAGNGDLAPQTREVDSRLLYILRKERRMSDHNTDLRGSKPYDFSPYRKYAAQFFRSRAAANATVPGTHPVPSPLVSNLKKQTRRLDPIILLSPSASSLIRMSNVKAFLDEKQPVFTPPSLDASSSNLLFLQRKLSDLDEKHVFRFFLTDSTTNFKPEYWQRVVAIFTTGQAWQFKGYKYPNPHELFKKIPGFYVGYTGNPIPETVKSWGSDLVLPLQVDKVLRYRDAEVSKAIWDRIEDFMREKDFGREGPGTGTHGR